MNENNNHHSNDSEEVQTFVKKNVPNFNKHRKMFPVFVVFAGFLFILGVVFLVFGIHKYNSSSNCKGGDRSGDEGPVKLAIQTAPPNTQQTKLLTFLNKMKGDFYQLYPYKVDEDPEADPILNLHRYQPYDSSWKAIKLRTDHALNLRKKLKDLDIKVSYLRPREKKALAQAEHYLESVFGNPYDEQYYTGDWMLGLKYACWQPFCELTSSLERILRNKRIVMKTLQDVESLMGLLKTFKVSIQNYQLNMVLGVKAGMVASVEMCKAGYDTFVQHYPKITDKGAQGWYLFL